MSTHKSLWICKVPEYSTTIITRQLAGMQGKYLPPPHQARRAPAHPLPPSTGKKKILRKKMEQKMRMERKWRDRCWVSVGGWGKGVRTRGADLQEQWGDTAAGEKPSALRPSPAPLLAPSVTADPCYHQHGSHIMKRTEGPGDREGEGSEKGAGHVHWVCSKWQGKLNAFCSQSRNNTGAFPRS